LSDILPLQNCLKQGDALSPLLFNFALRYVIRNVKEKQAGLKLNGIHQLSMYADGVNILSDDIHTITKYPDLRDIGWGGMGWIHLA
jgi:hypothetical protein